MPRALIALFAYLLPELGLPAVLYWLSRYAARLHMRRSGQGTAARRDARETRTEDRQERLSKSVTLHILLT